MRFKTPFNPWLPARNCSNWTPKSNRDSTSKVRTLKNYISSKGSSANGSQSSPICWMMTVTPKKNPQMQDPKSNWSTGESECRRSPIGANNSKTKISKLSKIYCSDNNNMMWDREDTGKRFPNSLWTTTDWIYFWLTNSTKPKTMSNIWLLLRNSWTHFTTEPLNKSSTLSPHLWTPLRWSTPLPDSSTPLTKWLVCSWKSPIKWLLTAKRGFSMAKNQMKFGSEIPSVLLRFCPIASNSIGNTRIATKRLKKKSLICQKEKLSISLKLKFSENSIFSAEEF